MPSPGKFVVAGSTGDVLTIAAPPAPSFIRIYSLQLTVSATSTVTLNSTSTVIDKAFLGTGNSYQRTDPINGILDCDPGASFVINNSAGTIAGIGQLLHHPRSDVMTTDPNRLTDATLDALDAAAHTGVSFPTDVMRLVEEVRWWKEHCVEYVANLPLTDSQFQKPYTPSYDVQYVSGKVTADFAPVIVVEQEGDK